MDDPIYEAAFALAGVIVGSFIAYRTGREQRKTDILTRGRQKWINGLRKDLAELYEARFDLADEIREDSAGSQSIRRQKALKRLRLLRGKVLLRLDEVAKARPSTRPQIALGRTVRDFSDEDGTLTKGLADRFISDGQAVIDAAWGQVKRME